MLATLLLSFAGLIVFIIVAVVCPFLKHVNKRKNNNAKSSSPKKRAPRNRARAQRQSHDHVYEQGPTPVSQAASPSAPSAEEQTPMAAIQEDIRESEYSLKNLDDAKKAIVYSEILKQKF